MAKKVEGEPETKRYRLKTGAGAHFHAGERVTPGGEVDLTDEQFQAFKDKFELADAEGTATNRVGSTTANGLHTGKPAAGQEGPTTEQRAVGPHAQDAGALGNAPEQNGGLEAATEENPNPGGVESEDEKKGGRRRAKKEDE